MESKIIDIIKEASKLSDKSLSRQLRVVIASEILRTASELDYKPQPEFNASTREQLISERAGKPEDEKDLYAPKTEHKDVDAVSKSVSRSLSTRYSPDRVGVQARRISDGIYQDPITNKVYDWNEGFKTESGDEITGGSVSHQTDVSLR